MRLVHRDFSKPAVVCFQLAKMLDFILSDFSSIKIMHLNKHCHIEMPVFTWYEQRAKDFTIYGHGEYKRFQNIRSMKTCISYKLLGENKQQSWRSQVVDGEAL